MNFPVPWWIEEKARWLRHYALRVRCWWRGYHVETTNVSMGFSWGLDVHCREHWKYRHIVCTDCGTNLSTTLVKHERSGDE